MNTDTKRSEYLTRDTILKLLSDDEVSRASSKEAGPSLLAGDEYLDLEHLSRGVQQMQAKTKIKMGEVLPRSAVGDATWSNICARLSPVSAVR